MIGRSALPGRAFAALTDDREVAEARSEPRRLAHGPPHAVELLGRHGPLRPAALADEVLPLPAGPHVPPGAVPEVDVLHQPEALERLEVAVDRGEIGGRQCADALRDLLGAERHIGRIQRLEHDAPRCRQAQAAGAQDGDGLVQCLGLDALAPVRGGHLLRG